MFHSYFNAKSYLHIAKKIIWRCVEYINKPYVINSLFCFFLLSVICVQQYFVSGSMHLNKVPLTQGGFNEIVW